MSVLDERDDYLKSPYFKEKVYSDFTPFYVTIAFCTVFCAILFILNIVLGCCSRYSNYWNDPHTGNRWIISLWTSTPSKQPPLDLKELEGAYVPPARTYDYHDVEPRQEYLELQKRESDI